MPIYEYEHVDAPCALGQIFELRQALTTNSCAGVRNASSRFANSFPALVSAPPKPTANYATSVSPNWSSAKTACTKMSRPATATAAMFIVTSRKPCRISKKRSPNKIAARFYMTRRCRSKNTPSNNHTPAPVRNVNIKNLHNIH